MRDSYQVTVPLPLDQAMDRVRYFVSYGKASESRINPQRLTMARRKNDTKEPGSAHFLGSFGIWNYSLTLTENREGYQVSTDADLELRSPWQLFIIMGILILLICFLASRSPYVDAGEVVPLMMLTALIAMGPPALICAMTLPKTTERLGALLLKALYTEHR